MNTTLEHLGHINERCLQAVEEFRTSYRQGESTRADFARIKQRFPYYGLLPCRAAGIDFVLFHAHDDVIGWEYLWFGDDAFETEIVSTWVSWARTSHLIYDVGAYTGLMSVLAAKANEEAQIHLWEPLDRTVERAKINLRVNGVAPRVTLHNKAAGDSSAELRLNLYREENFLGTGNSLYDKGLPVVDTKIVVQERIDESHQDAAPDLIKIDVEGHELATLHGLEKSVARGRPRMLIEIWEHTRSQTLDLLRSWGYHCEPFETTEMRVMNYRCVPVEAADPGREFVPVS